MSVGTKARTEAKIKTETKVEVKNETKAEAKTEAKIKLDRHAKSELNRKLKKEYELSKQRLLLAERNNYEYIFLIRTQDNWYKIISHSALIFLYYATPIIKKNYDEGYKPPRLLADGDFRYKAPIGVLTFKTLDSVKKLMKVCGFAQGKVDAEDSRVTVFKLDRKLSEEEFWSFKKEEDELWGKVNKVIVPTASFPNLGVDIREVTQLFYDIIRKMPHDAKELVGYNTMDLLRRTKTGLISAEKGYISWESFFGFAPKLIAEIQSDIETMAVARVEDKKVLLRMAKSTQQIETDISQAKKIYAKQGNNEK